MSKLPNSNNRERQTEEQPPSMPRWVKVSGVIVITLIMLFVILKLIGIGGNHGPGRHIPMGDSEEQIEHGGSHVDHSSFGGGGS